MKIVNTVIAPIRILYYYYYNTPCYDNDVWTNFTSNNGEWVEEQEVNNTQSMSMVRYYDNDQYKTITHLYQLISVLREPTYIIDNIYLGSAFNAACYYTLKKY